MTAPRIIQQIFKEPGLEKVTQWELEKLVTDYPFFTGARVLLAKRAFQRSSDLQHEAVIKALLYTNAPHYLYQFIQAPADPEDPHTATNVVSSMPAANATDTGAPAVESEVITPAANATDNDAPAVESELIAPAANATDNDAPAVESEVIAPAANATDTGAPAFESEVIAPAANTNLDEASAARQLDATIAAAHTPETVADLAEASELSVNAYEAIAAETQGIKAPEPALDARELDTLETGNLSVNAYEALEADAEGIKDPEPALDAHELDTLEAGTISIDAYEAIEVVNTQTEEAPSQQDAGQHPATPEAAILETTTGSFGTSAPELGIAFTQHITPAHEKPLRSFHEEMEAFRRELAEQQAREEAAAPAHDTPDTPIPAQPAVSEPATETPAKSDFHLQMEAFRQSLLSASDTAEEGATDQSVNPDEAAVLQHFNVHSFQDELEALKKSLTVEENTAQSAADTLEAGAWSAAQNLETAQASMPEAADATLETGAVAAPHSQHAEPVIGEVSVENSETFQQTLEAGARNAIVETESAEGLAAALAAAAQDLPDFVEEAPAFPAATLAAEAAAMADDQPVFRDTAATPAFTAEQPAAETSVPAASPTEEQDINAADIQLVSDAINDHLPLPSSLPADNEEAPRIITWMPPQQRSAAETAGTHASVQLPLQQDNGAKDAAQALVNQASTPQPAAAATDASPESIATTPQLTANTTDAVQATGADTPQAATNGTHEPAEGAHTAEAAAENTHYEEGPIKIYPLEMPEETDLTFQPLYTEDYFAYKKLADPVAAETMSDKGAQEMKSFTHWLRTMKDSFAEKTQKDWYHEQLHRVYEEEEESGISERVEKMALQSITLNDDIVSETLAEIWARQRQHQKAIQIYKKLSLLNPGKSAYFAQKINELQSDINK